MLWLDLKELAQGSDGFSTVIHEGGREQKFNVMSIDMDTAKLAEKFTFATEDHHSSYRDGEENYAGIMAVGVVFGAWVSQTHNHLKRVAWHSVTWLVMLT